MARKPRKKQTKDQELKLLRAEMKRSQWYQEQLDRIFRQAIIVWREHHGQPDTWPDYAKLVEWLLDRGDRWQAVMRAARDLDSNFNGQRYADLNDPDAGRWANLRGSLQRYDEFWQGAMR